MLVPAAEGDRDDAGRRRRVDVHRRLDEAAVRRADDHDVVLVQVELAGGRRVHVHPRRPRHGRDGVGGGLHPREVGEPTGADAVRLVGDQEEGVLVLVAGELGRHGCRQEPGRGRSSAARRVHVPPAAALERALPELLERRLRDRPAAGRVERTCRIADGVAHRGPGKLVAEAELAAGLEERVAEGQRVVEPVDGRLLEGDRPVSGAGVGYVGAPLLKRRVAGQDEIGERGRLVQEAGEADDRPDVPKRFAGAERARQTVVDIGVAHQEHVDRAGAHVADQLLPLAQRRRDDARRLARRVEDEPAAVRRVHGADQMVERVDGGEVEEAVGIRAGRAAADGERLSVVPAREVAGHLADALGAAPRLAEHALRNGARRECRERARPASAGERAGRGLVAEPIAHDRVDHRHREQPFGAGRNVDPLVGRGRGRREAGVDLHQVAPLAVALPELAVAPREVGRIKPRAQEVGAEAQQVARAGDVEVGQGVCAEHALDRRAQHRLVERVEADEPRAVGVREPARHVSEHPADRRRGQHHAGRVRLGEDPR